MRVGQMAVSAPHPRLGLHLPEGRTRRGAAPALLVPLAAAAGLGLALASLATWEAFRPAALEHQLVSIAVGEAFLAAGTILCLQSRGARVGALAMAIGVTWFIPDLKYAGPLVYTVCALGEGLPLVLLGHLAVAFPSGHLRSRLDRAVVAACYAAYPAIRVARLLFWEPFAGTRYNLLAVLPDARLEHLADQVGVAVSLALTCAVAATMFRHWWSGSGFERRTLTILVWSCLPVAAAVIVYSVVGEAAFPPLLGLATVALPLGLLLGLLRGRLDRAAVGRLVIELGESPGLDDLQEALARTVHDPALTVAYWLSEPGVWVDRDVRPLRLPEKAEGRTVTVLRSGNEPIAALVHDAGLDPELIEASATTARLAIENERFRVRIRSQLEEMRASRARIVAAADAERRRIERDLHDGAQQRLVTLSLALSLLRARVQPAANAELDRWLKAAAAELGAALDELRELARGIHPAILGEAGLGPALESLAVRLPMPVTVSQLPPGRLPPAVEAAAYFVVAEALTNVARHARASGATVRIASATGAVVAEVTDDGVGGADPALGSGLQAIADRLGAMDGHLEVVSPAGGGTRVRAAIPCAESPARAGAA